MGNSHYPCPDPRRVNVPTTTIFFRRRHREMANGMLYFPPQKHTLPSPAKPQYPNPYTAEYPSRRPPCHPREGGDPDLHKAVWGGCSHIHHLPPPPISQNSQIGLRGHMNPTVDVPTPTLRCSAPKGRQTRSQGREPLVSNTPRAHQPQRGDRHVAV